VLGVQEVGDPEALDDLRQLLEGDWHAEVSEFPDGRGIRESFLSRMAIGDVEQLREFPDGLRPVQVDDDDTTIAEMGRGALPGAASGRESRAATGTARKRVWVKEYGTRDRPDQPR